MLFSALLTRIITRAYALCNFYALLSIQKLSYFVPSPLPTSAPSFKLHREYHYSLHFSLCDLIVIIIGSRLLPHPPAHRSRLSKLPNPPKTTTIHFNNKRFSSIFARLFHTLLAFFWLMFFRFCFIPLFQWCFLAIFSGIHAFRRLMVSAFAINLITWVSAICPPISAAACSFVPLPIFGLSQLPIPCSSAHLSAQHPHTRTLLVVDWYMQLAPPGSQPEQLKSTVAAEKFLWPFSLYRRSPGFRFSTHNFVFTDSFQSNHNRTI